MQNLTNAAGLLKTVYRQMLTDMCNNETAIHDRFKKMPSELWEGKEEGITWAFRSGRTQAFGSYRPGGPLPESQHQPTQNMKVPLKFLGGRIGIDTPTMKVSRSNRGSFKRAWDYEMDMFKVDFVDYINEMSWGDGRGILAFADSASSTTTITVDSPGGVVGDINGARFLQPNMRIAILDSTGTTVLAVRRVVSVSDDGDSIVVNSAVTAAQCPDNALIVRAPNLSVTDVADVSYNRDPMGLIGMIDDGTYVNNYMDVNRTTTPLARSTVIPNVGALNLDVIQQLLDTIAQVGRGRPKEHWMSYDTRRSYLALTVANRSFISTGGATNNDIGFKGNAIDEDPRFGGAPIKCDKDAPYGIWFAWDTGYALNFENTPFEWADEDGAIMSRLDGVDAFEAVARMYFNRCDEKPSASGRLDDIDTNVVVAHIR